MNNVVDDVARAQAQDAIDRARENQSHITKMEVNVDALTKTVFGGVGANRVPLVTLVWIQTISSIFTVLLLIILIGAVFWIFAQI